MGRENNIMNSYLADPERFADFFNAVCFKGKKVICPQELREASEKYDIGLSEPVIGRKTVTEERIRDIKKLYSGGRVLRVLALENQSYIDYTAGLRNMEYDTMEYAEQLKLLKAKHKSKNKTESKVSLKFASSDEVLSGVTRSERLHPVYTLWFYHGGAEWDGPRSLKDMMNFGDDADGMSNFFNDYKMNLICLNEIIDLNIFHTELRQLFKVMKYRRDRKMLQNIMEDSGEFSHLEADTVEAMSVMLHMPEIWDRREEFMSINGEREEYDMCQGMREWIEEERSIGFNEGIEKGIESLVLTCKNLQCTKNDTKQQLMLMYEFDTEEEASNKVDLYWK